MFRLKPLPKKSDVQKLQQSLCQYCASCFLGFQRFNAESAFNKVYKLLRKKARKAKVYFGTSFLLTLTSNRHFNLVHPWMIAWGLKKTPDTSVDGVKSIAKQA